MSKGLVKRGREAQIERMLIDRYHRKITYLRLSVTDRCDLRCTYCMPERMTFLPKREMLSLDELYRLARAFMARGVRKIRLTGGEPLVRRDMIDLVRALGRHVGEDLDEITLTTNGTQLQKDAGELARAGVKRLNVSLDTLDRARFAQIARRDALPQVLDGIAAAKAAGLHVKLNAVVLADSDTADLRDLIGWAHGEGHDVTLIETMPLGQIDGDRHAQFQPLDRIRRELEAKWTLEPSDLRTGGPSRYVTVRETGGTLGFITPMTANFCDGCNRMRVTTTGKLYPCLGGGEEVDLRAALRSPGGDALDAALDEALAIKPERHAFAIRPGSGPAVERHMSVTGG